ncbi:MAG: AraC family transcriptional regulator, partial [Candidatus Accumulibacter sp.]|nr:AraC family transcriptional regulator [Accumulibacter sp.]
FLLGFREQSAFTHAFREWSGMNPGAWREQAA